MFSIPPDSLAPATEEEEEEEEGVGPEDVIEGTEGDMALPPPSPPGDLLNSESIGGGGGPD